MIQSLIGCILATTLVAADSSISVAVGLDGSTTTPCSGYYCAYGDTFVDRLASFYDLHAPKKKNITKIERLAEQFADHENDVFDELRTKYVRRMLHHKYPDFPLAPPFTRVTLEQLESDPAYLPYKLGRRPFVLVGAADSWPALKDRKWKGGKRLAELFPQLVTDFYPYNMLQGGEHPYLHRLPAALREVMEPTNFLDDKTRQWYPGRYLHAQLTRKQFQKLRDEGDIEPFPRWFDQDNWWMRRCLSDETAEEYHLKTHWQIVLIGNRGAGMFNHSDTLMTSSWHTHVEGKKWWAVCGWNIGSGPNQNQHTCHEDVLRVGDTLYYPKAFHHQTQNLVKPTMTLTGTVVNSFNWDSIADKLHSECARSALRFDFSAQLCDDLDRCYEQWQRRFTGKKTASRWRPWREVSTPDNIREKEKWKPHENNYDGRNHVAG